MTASGPCSSHAARPSRAHPVAGRGGRRSGTTSAPAASRTRLHGRGGLRSAPGAADVIHSRAATRESCDRSPEWTDVSVDLPHVPASPRPRPLGAGRSSIPTHTLRRVRVVGMCPSRPRSASQPTLTWTRTSAHGILNVSRVDSRRGVGLVVIAAMLWGTVGVTTQALYALSATTALSIGFFRLALGFPLLALASAHVLGRRAWAIPRRDLARMALMGVMLAQYQVCFFVSIRHAGVAVATLVTLCTAPVLVAALSAALASERPTWAVLLAFACALAGTALLVGFTPGSRVEGTSLYGVGFALASALGYAVITLVGRSVATVLAWVLFGEALSRFGAAGALLLLGAMGILLRDGRPGKAIPVPADGPSAVARV